jgi:hypothetical protein
LAFVYRLNKKSAVEVKLAASQLLLDGYTQVLG